jgi:hypothetical protein
MKALALSLALLAPAAVIAGPPNPRNHSGADDFRDVVVACMVAGLEAGAPDPVALAESCVQAAQVIWAASYPSVCSGFGSP